MFHCWFFSHFSFFKYLTIVLTNCKTRSLSTFLPSNMPHHHNGAPPHYEPIECHHYLNNLPHLHGQWAWQLVFPSMKSHGQWAMGKWRKEHLWFLVTSSPYLDHTVRKNMLTITIREWWLNLMHMVGYVCQQRHRERDDRHDKFRDFIVHAFLYVIFYTLYTLNTNHSNYWNFKCIGNLV